MPVVELSAGPIEYVDTGGAGPVVLMTGGLPMNATVWTGVVEALGGTHRCVVPTMPWGAHRLPMRADADLSLTGHARLLGEFIERLGLSDVTLVEVDTPMSQVLAAERPELIARLVICSCEAFDNYPPGLVGRMIGLVGRLPGGVNFVFQQMRLRPLRRSSLAYGRMSVRPIPHETTDTWFAPLQTLRAIRRDLTKYIRSVDRRALSQNAPGLARFTSPALVVWGAEDRMMPRAHGQRLADLLPGGRFVEVAGSGTLVPLDEPAELGRLIAELVADPFGAEAIHA